MARTGGWVWAAGRVLMARVYQPKGTGPFPTVLDLHGGAWGLLGAIGDFDYTGYIVVGVFVATWLVSWLIWRYGRIEERWAAPALADD